MKTSIKSRGELEKNGIESLPPTPISSEAKAIIRSWGITIEQVNDLCEFTSQFRYDLCGEKIARLAQRQAELFEIKDMPYVNLPSFYDVYGRLDSQCSDIARQWIIRINENHLIQILNSQRTDENRIVTCYYTGLSKTHFCYEGLVHAWNGLALLSKDNQVLSEVYFDAAFQVIMGKSESGYSQKTVMLNVRKIFANESVSIPIGWSEDSDTSWKAAILGTVVLGVSNDSQYAYSIGFVLNRKTNEVKPIIGRLNSDGASNYFIYGNKRNLICSSDAEITYHQQVEIRNLLDNAEKIKFAKVKPTINRVNWMYEDITG